MKNPNKRAFTINEAAEYACVSRATLHNWMVSGLLPFEVLPSRGEGLHKFRLIRKLDLDEFLDNSYCVNKKDNKTSDFTIRIIVSYSKKETK